MAEHRAIGQIIVQEAQYWERGIFSLQFYSVWAGQVSDSLSWAGSKRQKVRSTEYNYRLR